MSAATSFLQVPGTLVLTENGRRKPKSPNHTFAPNYCQVYGKSTSYYHLREPNIYGFRIRT
jgi:hypothetical protein